MDECLLHAEVTDVAIKGCADQMRQAHARAEERKDTAPDFEFELPYLDAPVRVFKRPGLDDFLLEAGRVAELVLYTSAAEGYASQIVKQIDPTGAIFVGVLTRQHCRRLQTGSYAKDLAALGRRLERTVLVDDSSSSFMMQPDNGIPITAFLGDPADRDLVRILHLLRHLHEEGEDVRPFLRERFRVQEQLLERVRDMRSSMSRHF